MSFNADRPRTDPKEDLFGHAQFAQTLAKGISGYAPEDGIVIALHGPWGSGKSTVLNYVQYYLEENPEKCPPVIVHFNPWWFSGQDNLVRAFLGQLQAALPDTNDRFKAISEKLFSYAEVIGAAADLSGLAGLGTAAAKASKELAKPKPQDVPKLKAEISKLLSEAKIRILVIVDDIDRLLPEETRELFTVIKAVADFPYVMYLLAFDRQVASQAIEKHTGLPGERFLEKITQVSFDLPPIESAALNDTLKQRITKMVSSAPKELFDPSYFASVCLEGLSKLVKVPRDLVRLTNTLSVTYPAVQDEVNAVDFIALEALRLFAADVYSFIWSNQDLFTGPGNSFNNGPSGQNLQAFHDKWMSKQPEETRESVQRIIHRIFPLTAPAGSVRLTSQGVKSRHACHPEFFRIYFCLSIPDWSVGRAEMSEFLQHAKSSKNIENALHKACKIKTPIGLSKAHNLLARLISYTNEDLPHNHFGAIIEAVLNIGDGLLVQIDWSNPHPQKGMLNWIMIIGPVEHSIVQLRTHERLKIAKAAILNGVALSTQLNLLLTISERMKNNTYPGGVAPISSTELIELQSAWLQQARKHSVKPDFVHQLDFATILKKWGDWATPEEVSVWCSKLIATDDGLQNLIRACIRYQPIEMKHKLDVDAQIRLNPKWLERFLDTKVCADRLIELQTTGQLRIDATEAVSQFLIEYEMINQGKDPDAIGAFRK